MASLKYNLGSEAVGNGTHDFLTSVVKIALIADTYTPNKDDTVATIMAHEINVTGYAPGFAGAGRQTLASKTVTRIDASDRVKYDVADPATWTALAAGVTILGALTYFHLTSDAASTPLAFGEYASGIPTNGGDFTHQFHADGITYEQQ